jgi:large subunit ribosomal protein L3
LKVDKDFPMIEGLFGKKIGMTQVYSKDKVVPVTVIDVGDWIVTGLKTKERDGYDAVQIGCVKDRYKEALFSYAWIEKVSRYFSLLREVKLDKHDDLKLGMKVDFHSNLEEGEDVDVFGKTKGRGFAGVMKRHKFKGGPASHGAKVGRRPGSIGFMTSCGRVIKGKKMPGHLGDEQRVMKNLTVMKIDRESKVILVKGSIPGTTGSFVFIRKQAG